MTTTTYPPDGWAVWVQTPAHPEYCATWGGETFGIQYDEDNVVPATGTRCVKFYIPTGRNALSTAGIISDRNNVIPNQQYRMELIARTSSFEGGTQKHVYAAFTFYNSSGTFLDSLGGFFHITALDTWQRFVCYGTAPSTAATVELCFYVSYEGGNSYAVDVWLDSLILMPQYIPPRTVFHSYLAAADVSTYFDATGLGLGSGPFTGWAICNGNNGTPNLADYFIRGHTAGAGGTGGAASNSHSHTKGTLHTCEEVSGGHRLIKAVSASSSWVSTERADVAGVEGYSTTCTYGVDIGGSTESAGSATGNLPPYYGLVPLMRVD